MSSGREHLDIARLLTTIANNYADMGRTSEALSVSERALRIIEKVEPESSFHATIVHNLGHIYADAERPA